MASTIKIKNSSTTGAVPGTGDLVQGELAINVTDTGIYTENASGTVVKLNAPSIDDKNTGATKHVTIDSSGNLGFGVTPSAWYSGIKVLQVGTGSLYSTATTQNTLLGSNEYLDSSATPKYIVSDYATRYQQYEGAHKWFNAASGTAGNAISFTQAMTLDSSGNLLVGATSTVAAARGYINAPSGSNGWTTLVQNNSNVLFNGYNSSGTQIFYVKGDGGIANYSANNINLSDERTKTDIQAAGGYLDKICAIPVKTFKYKNQEDDLLNLGVIAQDVEAVAPELVDISGFGETPEDGIPLKAIYQTDLQYALMKAIQEQQAMITSQSELITQLQADVAALKGN